jgi:hypothetical protein
VTREEPGTATRRMVTSGGFLFFEIRFGHALIFESRKKVFSIHAKQGGLPQSLHEH